MCILYQSALPCIYNVRDTSRGTSIKSFIKSGKAFGEVSIVLSNAGKDAFKPESYGDKIIIERRFTPTSSTYKVKSAMGQTISNKGEKLKRHSCAYDMKKMRLWKMSI